MIGKKLYLIVLQWQSKNNIFSIVLKYVLFNMCGLVLVCVIITII